MKSAAKVYLEMFSIVGARIRPTKLEGVLMALLHTLSANGLLDEAIENSEKLIGLDPGTKEGLAYIKAITTSPEMVGLYKHEKAMQLILKLKPHIAVCEGYSMVTLDAPEVTGIVNRAHKSHVYAELKKILGYINSLDLGYKVVQKPKESLLNEFHIIKYEDRTELLRILMEQGLQMPSVLDKVM